MEEETTERVSFREAGTQTVSAGSINYGANNNVGVSERAVSNDYNAGAIGIDVAADRAETPVAGNPMTPRTISIDPLNYGFVVRIGCQSFAVETPEKLVANLQAYLTDPSGTERKWMRERKLV